MNANEKNGRAAKIEQLLDWPTSVAEAGWRAVADADKVFVEYYERDKPESEVEGEDFAAVYGTRNDENARLMAAAPDLYRAARLAAAFLEHSSLMAAAEIRADLISALAKAGGFGKGGAK